MSKKYSVLLADLDNTLLDFSSSERIAVSRLLEHYGGATEKALIDYPSYNDSLWKQLERGEITRKQLVQTRFAGFFKRHGINGDGAEAATLYQKYLSESAIWMQGAEELLIRCRGKVKVYIISNGIAAVQLPRVRSSGIDKLTDGHFISEIVGYDKPNIRYFEKISTEIPEFDRNKTLVLGDSLTADIAGGKAFGCDTCLFDRYGKYVSTGENRPDFVIHDLSELYKILDI